MRGILIALVLLGAAFAALVPADVRGTKDTGNASMPKMDVGIAIDCASKALIVTAKSNSTGEIVAGAQTYLFYTDYEYQLVGSGSTNASGIARISIMGNPDFLTALFILRLDKAGYQSRETEFTYKYCFEEPPEGIGDVYGEELPPEEPELKKMEIGVEPICAAGNVTGNSVLVTSGGLPLQGAFVSVEDVSPAKKITAGETDASGLFVFPGCGGDEFSVRASKGGYESVEERVNLTLCDDCPSVAPPPPPPPSAANGTQPPAPGGGNATKPETGDGKPASGAPSACPLGIILLSALALRSVR